MITTEDNIDDIVRLEEETWPEGTRASKEAFENRVKLFPKGVIGARDEDNNLIGLATSCILYKDDVTYESRWETLTDYGMITTHKEDGDVLYLVSLGVNPKYQRKGAGRKLLNAQNEQIRAAATDTLEKIRTQAPVKPTVDPVPQIKAQAKDESGIVRDVAKEALNNIEKVTKAEEIIEGKEKKVKKRAKPKRASA